MEHRYYSRARAKVPANQPVGTAPGFSGPVPGNMQMLDALGADSAPDAGLESAMGARFSAHFGTGDVVQMKRADEPNRGKAAVGSPSAIISDLGQRSGVDLSDVKIHRNSPAPGAIDALAYARGTDVFLGPGQERHLGHELTHVVQQKQGLVHANDSVSGMLVNTSPALEQAADAMSVSAAPETGFAGAGVVQGVFLDPSGQKVSRSDLKTAEKMLKGSMDSILQAAQERMKTASSKAERKQIEKAIKTAKKQMGKKLKTAQKSKSEFDLATTMTQIMDDAYGQMGFSSSSSIDAMRMAAGSGSQQATSAAFGAEGVLKAKDTTAGLETSMGGFQLPTEAAEGIESIGEYDPASDKAEELLGARMGNSGTLMAREDETPEQRAAREKSSESFQNGAEVARQGATDMRADPDNISAGNLFQLFSSINEQVRGGGADAGQLRGKTVTAGQMSTPGPAALPEDAYRTFSQIANMMQEIKKTDDPKLAKTQAVHLAAFAYQMTVSEHMFGDGNGRTCRLLADTILQTFGLPPMSPVKELAHTGATIGTEMDFNAGANAMMEGVRQSDQTLRESRNGKFSDQVMAYRTTAVPANYDPATASDDETLAMLYQLIKNPRPEDTEEDISARRRHFAQLRAAQMRRQEARA